MKAQLAHLRFAAGRLGLLGWVGIGLLLGAAFYALSLAPARDQAMESARADAARWQKRQLAVTTRLAGLPMDEVPAITLPNQSMTPALLGTLQEIAGESHVDIRRNDYRYVEPAQAAVGKRVSATREGRQGEGASAGKAAPAEGVVEVRIVVPAKGRYKDLRAFLSEALERLPTLALDGLTLRRDNISVGEVEAQLHFTLFVKGRP